MMRAIFALLLCLLAAVVQAKEAKGELKLRFIVSGGVQF